MIKSSRLVLLGVLALFIASGIAPSAASAGPVWHVNGTTLTSGIKQLNLQMKGKAVLKSKISASEVTIECENAASEGAAIEGNGQLQGQDKGRLTFTTCKVFGPLVAKCKVGEPLTTNNTKSALVTYKGAQSKYADLYEPVQGETFAQVKLQNNSVTEICKPGEMTVPVKGSVAAEVVPKESEGQEGLLNFPATPIEEVFHEQVTKKIGLFLGAEKAKFAAAYGAKLVSGEKWGVFG